MAWHARDNKIYAFECHLILKTIKQSCVSAIVFKKIISDLSDSDALFCFGYANDNNFKTPLNQSPDRHIEYPVLTGMNYN